MYQNNITVVCENGKISRGETWLGIPQNVCQNKPIMQFLLKVIGELGNIDEYITDLKGEVNRLKEQEIAKLQEHKSSLINSVVTGKVKVC
ncbi:hypothetical protein K1F50_10135 [Muricauda oceani]|uniref:DUF1192 domain-containing protein n=1 Tax=Flagellimonas oceani TaxID=2698672 RepID=A0A6G7J2P1_9FLAO|nr:DUF1192 domain-containing protein [Allomuricauda oceani]MBW8243159.1 hypothetical protein [Allomuricauda oceani]QII45141.1 DUF1192 domain-containing protein [Allomuricauda oceani]